MVALSFEMLPYGKSCALRYAYATRAHDNIGSIILWGSLRELGTLYKGQKGKPATMCKFRDEEKRSFEQHALTNQHKNLQQDA